MLTCLVNRGALSPGFLGLHLLRASQALGAFFHPVQTERVDDIYSSDGEELRLKLAAFGLEMYVGVMPHLISTDGVVEKLPGMWSYAFGHAIYLDIDRMEEGT